MVALYVEWLYKYYKKNSLVESNEPSLACIQKKNEHGRVYCESSSVPEKVCAPNFIGVAPHFCFCLATSVEM